MARLRCLAGAGVFTAALAACFSAQDLAELQSLQKAIQAHFELQLPGVELRDDTLLLIGLEDSAFLAMDTVQLAKNATAIAAFVRDTFPAWREVRRLVVGYSAVGKSGPVIVRRPYFVQSFSSQDLAP
jgi:hypothetical protein